MGCINSKKDINDVHPNIFHVINVDDDGEQLWSGQLEVSRTELTLYRKGKDPTTWPLKCLRRYGYNVDQFSFEAGRRCTTGEGIYAFKCRRAETLFYTVQSYIQGRIYSDENTNPNDPYPIPVASAGPAVRGQSVSQNNTATRSGQSNGTGTGNFVINRGGITTSQSLSPNGTIHSNSNQSRSTDTLPNDPSYLEPSINRPQTAVSRFTQGLRLSSVSSGPISPDVTSPGSPNSVTNILEVTTLNPLPAASATSSTHHGVSNLYQEFPMKDGCSGVVASTVHRMSLDIPPLDEAPSVEPDPTSSTSKMLDVEPIAPEMDPSRMYMNVNIAYMPENVAKAKVKPASKSNSSLISINNNSGSFDENQYQYVKTPTSSGPNMFAHLRMNSAYSIDPTRCYENLEPGEIKAVIPRGRYSKPDIFANVDLPLDSSEPCTPTGTDRTVNYIELCLDQSNSLHNITGSAAAAAAVTSPTGSVPVANNNNSASSDPAPELAASSTTPVAPLPIVGVGGGGVVPLTGGQLPPESPKKASLGYATIDFTKTNALSNSTTPSSELDSEGSRKTRHNSTVATPLARQSNSVSD